jgi:hypothetical protein
MTELNEESPITVTATLNARLQPKHRAEIEDGFDEEMEAGGHGVRVVGGGTLMGPSGEVKEVDIEIELDRPTQTLVNQVIEVLESMRAPKGSRLTFSKGDPVIPFGTDEGLALYLNGSDLSDAVYEACSPQEVWNQCDELLGDVGAVFSFWIGPTETALYMYGTGFNDMKDKIAPCLRDYPLCEKCRIEQIA